MKVVTTAAVSKYISPPKSDHRYAASTPRLTSVSIVAAPCLRFNQAARWNGHAPQVTTGVARRPTTHGSTSSIDSTTTGTVRTAATARRTRKSSGASGSVAP